MKGQDEFSRDKEICMNFEDEREKFGGSVIPPVFHNTLFIHDTFEDLIQSVKNEEIHYAYSRGTNPTVEVVEKKLAALERGEECKCFASGMAAITAALVDSVQAGDHVLCISNLYFSTMELLKLLEKFQVSHSVVYTINPDKIEQAVRPNTKVIFIESPTDMNFRLIDLKGVANLAKRAGIRTIIDNTWATPIFQKPLTFGIDIVVHSASKYLGGHSDVLGGALVTERNIMTQIFQKEYLLMGASMPANEAALLLRGLRTLPFRMLSHQENALKIAHFLQGHPRVERVHYPGLESHPEYPLGQRQMSGYSGLMSFELKDRSFPAVKSFINKLNTFKIGVSWGSFESLAMSPNIGTNQEQLVREHISPGTIRLAVGLEDALLLMDDLKQALE